MKIKGVNLGGWLLMEGYILHGRNVSESFVKKNFEKKQGKKALREFEHLFRETFITEQDFKNLADMGATAVRLPFNHRLIERKPFRYQDEGFGYLQKALQWGEKHRIGIILDLHAAPGAQNCDWHSDSGGEALLWTSERFRKRTYALWEAVADRVKGSPALIGYDLLNEPVLDPGAVDQLKNFYREAVRRLRAVDPTHTLFLEGNAWAQQINFLGDLLDDKVTISIHTYHPLPFVFNFTPRYHFPGTIENDYWDPAKIRASLEPYHEFARKHGIRIFVGEFGVNWRGGYFGETQWLESMLSAYDEFGFDYTYWTYKAVANSVFPDGLYQYLPDNAYVRREGPTYGWENYEDLWDREKDGIVSFWKTEQYTPNTALIEKLREHFTKP
jgi:aryl-phospho-beta-D-glucosidase BglC (GH1 family)